MLPLSGMSRGRPKAGFRLIPEAAGLAAKP
jgi:hypothetical protein